MANTAVRIVLRDDERRTLESWTRAGTAEQRTVMRAKIVIAAAEGHTNSAIAVELGTSAITVGKWRRRFAQQRLSGLQDAVRPGRPPTYDRDTERRILALLDEDTADGYTTWNGPLIAKALGDVSAHQVWRVLRRHGISLQRRRSWCISTDPEFAQKVADIIGLYLNPPENAVVIRVDEKPSIQALQPAQGWLRLPNGRALTGRSHEYKRNGTTTLFAALEVATGLVQAGHYRRRRRREFLDFMNQIVAHHSSDTQLHVILDNLNTHKPKHERWLARHKNVHFHFTPTHASWLNQIEIWFSILSRKALKGASFSSVRELREGMDKFIEAYTKEAAPFEWTKREVHQKPLKPYYKDLCK